VVFSNRRLFVSVALLVLLQTGTRLSAQSSSSSQVDCKDPFWIGTSSCQQSTPTQGTSTDTSGSRPTSTDPTQSQRTLDRNGQVYIDSAGTEPSRQSGTNPRDEASKLAPDPVIDLQRLAKASTGEALPVFGRDLFRRAPSTFAPPDQMAPLPDYVIGPGDQILLRLWGHDSLNSQLTVDDSGSIYVPQVGAIHVAGLRFDQLDAHIRSELNRTYHNFNLSINLGSLRSIQVYVVGEARQPGALTLSSLSTVLNALLVSGGPSVQGSLRRIQIRREGKPPLEFDLYDLILSGDKSKDVRLQTGDTIFIPPVGPQVALAGSVRHPGIYEMRADLDVAELVTLAGGFSSTASRSQISLDRIEDGQVRRSLSVGLDAAGMAMKLHDGDVLYVNHITRGYEQSVTIRGNLANAGRFPWHPGMKLSEIIPDRSSLLTNGYWRERNRLGVPTPLFEPIELYVPATSSNTQHLRSQNSNQPQKTSNSSRATPPQEPNEAPASDQLGDFSQLSGINRQDSTTPSDSLTGIALEQETNSNPRDRSTAGEKALDPGSLAEDQEAVSSPSLVNRGVQNRIQIPAPEIDWSYAVIERLDPNTLKTSLVPFNLGRLVQDHDPSQDLELQAGDVVTILSQSDVHGPIDDQTKYVRLEGEFVAAGTYSVGPNETLNDVVRRAGGLTPKAYLFGASFTRETARVLQQQRLDEYVSTLSIDMERAAAVRTVSSASGITDPNALVQERSLVTQLKQLRATGRIVLEFRPESTGTEAIPNLGLEDGDVLRVPSKPLIVSVIGAVYGQNIFLYDGKRRVEDYLLLAGNPNRIADSKHAFIIRADGAIYSRDRAKGVWSNNFQHAQVNPGDTIVIPEKLIRPSAMRQVIDYSQIFSQFALGAAAVNIVR